MMFAALSRKKSLVRTTLKSSLALIQQYSRELYFLNMNWTYVKCYSKEYLPQGDNGGLWVYA